MLLIFFFIISIIQFFTYKILYKSRFKYADVVALFIFFIANVFFLPQFFFPDKKLDCGLPVMSIYFAFWIFGTIFLVATFVFARKSTYQKGT